MVGRSDGADIKIGHETDVEHLISKIHATIYYSEHDLNFYVRDGGWTQNGFKQWRYSTQGIYIDGRKVGQGVAVKLRPGCQVDIFPRIDTLGGYRCLLEWPVEKEDDDDTDHNPPTVEQVLAITAQKEVFKDEAFHNRKRLEEMAKTLVSLQKSITEERNEFNQKFEAMAERQHGIEAINRHQEEAITQQAQKTLKIKIGMAVLAAIVILLALFALQVDQENVIAFLEWSQVVVVSVGAVLGIKELT